MQRRFLLWACFGVSALLTLVMTWTAARAQGASTPPAPQPPEAFAYAAPALIKELDSKYPFPPPAPPSPPRRGGVLHVPTGVLRSFDPTVGYSTELSLVWDTLLEWESTWYFPEAHTKPMIRKSLAESWHMVDPSTWVFQLRQGVKFHNLPPVHGREMTADDVRYSYELLKNKPGYSNRTAAIQEVQVLDPYTVRFHLAIPDPNFPLNHVNSFSPVIVPKEAVEAEGGLGKYPIGTGAFLLKEFATGEGALLVKNPHYFMRDKDGQSLPYVDAIRLFFTRDAATEAALFRSRRVDMMRPPTLDMLNELLKTVPDAWLYRIPSLGWTNYGLWLPFGKPPYNDVRVRQAISMALNRDIIAETINRGDASLYGPFPWVQAGYTQRDDYSYANLGPNYTYNPKRAKELLAEAGHPNGLEMTIEWGEFRGAAWSDFVVSAARFLEDIGIRVKLKQVDTSTWWAMRSGAQPFNDVLASFTPPGSGPSFMDWVYLPHHSSSPPTVNIPHIADAKLDALLDAWRAATGERQLAIQKQVWDYLREQVYRVTTIVPPHYRLTQAYLHAGGVPYCWFIGFCSYEGKSAWLTDKVPNRKFDKFAQ
ncbi:MAG: ABC transporter substrate-binding protein [Candidatus Tectomicrobia bacterium]|uniref:ABC transporter substrate-binding protein n=1 Tax=Tectimicrobiota bacterium TaxID=2528274 RepID=A0A937VXM5_UNCTE|nr:ABC transporter substrate-binding protein [Candidatus Tectomicrobia bacterium]